MAQESRLRKMAIALNPYDIEGAMFQLAGGCPCGLQYPRLLPPEGWTARIIRRKENTDDHD